MVHAQDMGKIRGLEQKLVSSTGTERYNLLLEIAFEYRNSFPDSTIIHSNEAYEMGRSLKLNLDMARPLNYIGLAYGVGGNYRKSLDYLERAIRVATSQKDSVQLGYCFNNLGRILLESDEQEKAFENFESSQRIFMRMGDQEGLAYVKRSLSDFFRQAGNFIEAERYALEALNIRYTLGDNRSIISSLLELGLLYEAMGNTSEASNRILQAEDRARLLNDSETLTEVKIAFAEAAFQKGDFAAASGLSREVLKLSERIYNKKMLVRIHLLRAKVLYKGKDWRGTLLELNKMTTEARNTGNLLAEKEGLILRLGCYEEMGDETRIDETTGELKLLEEKIANSELRKETERLHLKLAIEKDAEEIAIYKLRQISDRSLLFQKENENLILVSALGLFFIACGLLFFLLIRRNQLNRKLAAQNEQILKQQQLIQVANERLESRNTELHEMSAEKDSLMSVVAHDLKSPLNQISGFARLIKLEGELTPNQNDHLNRLTSTISRGLELINNILEVNSYQRAGNNMKVQPMDVPGFVQEKEKNFRVLAEAKQITLNVVCSGRTVFDTVPDHLSRIVDNLVSNAIKFSPIGSTVGFNVQAGEDELHLIVSDSGPGFTDEDRQGLFKQFRKLSARPTGNESSSGLGLAIVKVLVDRLNGTIELDSAPGKGATFTVKIPMAPGS
ncbi:MAG: ATP-binding protein [Bacteroidota bacterium]